MQDSHKLNNPMQPAPELLSGGGEMGERMRQFDWSKTPLGAVEDWPQSLKTAVRIMLTSRQPIWLGWGEDLIKLYNDAYISIVGGKHPQALGQSAFMVWREILNEIGPMLKTAMGGIEGTYVEEQLLIMERNGYPEETYYTFSYSPIPNDQGGVGGIICANTDETAKVLSARRLRTLRLLAEQVTQTKSAEEICEIAARNLDGNPNDLPFALLYLLDSTGEHAHLAGASGMTAGTLASPERLTLNDDSAAIWPFQQIKLSGKAHLVTELEERFGKLPGGAWPESPKQALALPFAKAGQDTFAGFLVAGISPRLPFDDNYRGFMELTAGHIATALANARAYEEERKRAEALAELDQAKTAFFSNVSHEFRTPLTLMLGPLETALSGPLDAKQREELEVVHRNGIRLQKLVNTLLDFSRLEAGRMQAVYEPTDLAHYTIDLASVFRSAVERTGMQLIVDCPPLPQPVYVDREMWEKIVLNLLSNALKFTFDGTITVSLRLTANRVELRVQDTGTGIPEAELPHLFERFHRIRGARARTHEGTGIGLALVQELVKFHGGHISVESALGKGTTFVVSIPVGSAHLPSDRIKTGRPTASAILRAEAYVEEGMRWTPADAPDEESSSLQASEPGEEAEFKPDLSTCILLADDNADMRQYVKHILDKRWGVEVVADGNAALEAARRRTPDLVISDVMMPGLDGFELLRELRGDLRTRNVPVILLSARAGEESRIEGLDAGADDYLVKPFSARELLARVGAYLKLTRLRRETQEQIKNILESITDGFVSLDRDWRFIYINAEAEGMGLSRDQLLGKPIWDAFPDIIGTNIESALRRAADEQVAVEFEGHNAEWQRTYAFKAYPNGDDGLTIYFQDITERKQAEETLRASQAQLQTLFDEAPIGIYLVDADFRLRQVNPRARPVFGDIPDLIGRDFDEVIHRLWSKEYADEIVHIFRHTLATGEPHFTAEKIEERLDRGVTEYYEWQANRIPLPTGGYGVVCYFRDISAEVFARHERERLLQAEREAREVADQASRAKDEFLATVSHELRNPLNAMLGWARVLSGNDFTNEIRARGLKSIEQNAKAQAQLIEDLLDVSRIVSGKFRLNVEPIQVVGVIEAAIESVRPAADARGVRLQATLDPGAGPVSGDAGRLQQVVWNLLANAVKFTQKGGRVQVRLARVNSHIEVVVSDTGQGIVPEFLPYVFDRFRQADGSSTRIHGGLGLGLAIVRHIVELHGGSVAAESPGKNQGATFTVRLPLMVIHTKPDEQAGVHPKLSGEGTLHFTPSLLLEGVKVLIVDDEPETLLLLSTVLTQSGAYVKTAASAAEGLREVQAWRPQVIVSDIGMPEENGFAFMKRVKGWARETGAWIPAVALTAYARAEDRIKALESGYQIHVPKPVEPAELVTVVASLVERSTTSWKSKL